MSWRFVLAACVIYYIWRQIDRQRNPGKWAKIDEAEKANQAARRERAYQSATQRVPPSEWMRMNKHQKADVLKRREDAIRDRTSI